MIYSARLPFWIKSGCQKKKELVPAMQSNGPHYKYYLSSRLAVGNSSSIIKQLPYHRVPFVSSLRLFDRCETFIKFILQLFILKFPLF